MEHQHFIPRSYLKNFALHQKKKRFVDAYELSSKKTLSHVSTKDVCVKSGLYTAPEIFINDPYALEKYYDQNVDNVYPEVYQLLTDQNKTIISNNQKHKILNTVLSLYFRTPKLLDAQNNLTERLIDRVVDLTDEEKEDIHFKFEEQQFSFKRTEINKFKANNKEQNRLAFLSVNFKTWKEFVQYKYKCGISVVYFDENIDLITSDNPVNIHSSIRQGFYLFEPTNIIQIPIDRKNLLYLSKHRRCEAFIQYDCKTSRR